MTEQTEKPDTISREAHERVLAQRDEYQSKLGEASKALADLKLVTEAQAFYTGKVRDPLAAAEMSLPKIRSVEDQEARQAALEASVPLFAPLETTTTEPVTGEVGEVVPEAPPTPQFMRPNPSSDGPAPPETKMTMRSPEVRALIEQGAEGQAKVHEMIKAGTIEFSPLNRTASNQ